MKFRAAVTHVLNLFTNTHRQSQYFIYSKYKYPHNHINNDLRALRQFGSFKRISNLSSFLIHPACIDGLHLTSWRPCWRYNTKEYAINSIVRSSQRGWLTLFATSREIDCKPRIYNYNIPSYNHLYNYIFHYLNTCVVYERNK